MATLVDTNVLLDVLTSNSTWAERSALAVATERARDSIVLNPIIYTELAASFATRAELDAAFPESWIGREDLPWDVALPASRAFLAYRRRGGARTTPLPDFFIGAHAEVRGHRLLTRDKARFATYFPTVPLVAP